MRVFSSYFFKIPHNMKKIIFFCLSLLVGISAFAQVPEDPDKIVIKPEGYEAPLEERPLSEYTFRQRLRFGGGLSNISFGNPTSVGLSPMLGYMATKDLIIGVGGTYQYYSLKLYDFNGQAYRLKNNLLAYRIFARHNINFLKDLIQNTYAQAEYEQFESLSAGGINYRPSVLVGAGFSTGGRFSLNVTALYDLNYRTGYDPRTGYSYSPYGSPLVLRISFF